MNPVEDPPKQPVCAKSVCNLEAQSEFSKDSECMMKDSDAGPNPQIPLQHESESQHLALQVVRESNSEASVEAFNASRLSSPCMSLQFQAEGG